MKDYHFEKDNDDFDETIRLDDINREMKKLEQEQPEDDLGDKDAFLDAFETEKFEQSKISEEPRQPSGAKEAAPFVDGDEPMFNKKTAAIIAALAVIVAIACFAIVRGMFFSGNSNQIVSLEQTPVLIQGALASGELIVYDIKADVNKSIAVTEETEFTNAQGQVTTAVQLNIGELIMVGLDKDGKSVLSLNMGGEIEIIEETGLTADIASKQLLGAQKNYSYGEKAVFMYNQEEIHPKDLEACDVLILKSYEDIVWSVDVAEYHGYISVENKDNIINGMFQLDDEEPVPLEDLERIAVKEGTHTVTVLGDNIEKRTDSIFVETGEEYKYDLSKAQEKVGVLIINSNVSDYKLYVNGTLVDSVVPSVLPLGEYDVVILKTGYLEWSQRIVLNADTLTIDANLQKDIQFGTVYIVANVDGTQIYIDGKEMGTAPMECNLPFGSYTLEVEKSGFQPFSTTITVNGSFVRVNVELYKE
ncbi:PEGA domain protein [Anaerotignum neopropionicum]|uniref:PEGA domain protein n=1 Tax=Anaerotignum neopropionicum TaxID=36847 RepID=A0A136WHY8_9FIRM|nr:PEGA domain-containing protein [Anaerotignum neopropionicum]KXL53969.1 PEGA domain protein [Anaerotignum neopropionicum]